MDYNTNGQVSSRLNTHVNCVSHKNDHNLSVIIANRQKSYNEDYAVIWSELTKSIYIQGQLVGLDNFNIEYKGHDNIILGDIIVLGRSLELYEIPIAYKNPRSFLSDAIIFFPKEKYTDTYAIEACSNTKVMFKTNGIII